MLWLNLGNCVQLLVGCEFNDNLATIHRTTGGRDWREQRDFTRKGKENSFGWEDQVGKERRKRVVLGNTGRAN